LAGIVTERARPQKKHPRVSSEYSRYEQRLRAAKNAGHPVKFALAAETYFTDEDCVVYGKVIEVTNEEVLIDLDSNGVVQISLNRHLIVATEILS
jgi:hypothetical protein